MITKVSTYYTLSAQLRSIIIDVGQKSINADHRGMSLYFFPALPPTRLDDHLLSRLGVQTCPLAMSWLH